MMVMLWSVVIGGAIAWGLLKLDEWFNKEEIVFTPEDEWKD